jgi:hypothetical protein
MNFRSRHKQQSQEKVGACLYMTKIFVCGNLMTEGRLSPTLSAGKNIPGTGFFK